MHLQGVIADWDQISQIAGSKNDEFLQEVADNFSSDDSDDDALDRASAVVGQIVSGDRIEDREVVGYAVDLVYRAFGNWAAYSPEVECDEADLRVCAEGLRQHRLADRVRALDWSRGSPILPPPATYPRLRLAYMTPPELAACGACLKTQDWSSLTPGGKTVMTALAEWVEEAVASPDLGLLITLWE